MEYINYKKNELIKINITDFKSQLPDLKNVEKTSTLANWLMNWIDNNLESSFISVGHLLPKKSELAYFFGVSIGTMQNVLRMLEDKNYIYSKQCIGSIIKDRHNLELNIRKKTSKKDIAEEKIKEYIKNNNYKQGDILPSSRNLAKDVSMMLNTVRNAIQMLISQEILEYNHKKDLIIINDSFTLDDETEETLVNKVKHDLKKYICESFKIGDKLPNHNVLARKFNVSIKTIHNAVQMLVRENMLLSRRGAYGTIITNISMNPEMEPRPEMSIFAPASETAFYHYEKIKNKIKNIISNDYDIGAKLPSIVQLSQFLDVNTNTIRRALHSLSKEGIVKFTRGRYGGTYVIDLPEVAEQTFRWLAVNPQFVKNTKLSTRH